MLRPDLEALLDDFEWTDRRESSPLAMDVDRLRRDASVVVDWVSPEADPSGTARTFLDELAGSGGTVIGPGLLLEEVSNALLTGCRRGRWDGSAADEAFALLGQLPVRLLDERRDLERAWELSRRYDEHPVYDMIYVALAERLGETLVTADEALVRRLRLVSFVELLS